MDKVAQDPVLTKVWFDGLSGTIELSESDGRRFGLLLVSLARRWENAFHQSRSGVLESASWAGMRGGLAFVFSAPGAQTWWKARQDLFSAEFVAFAEGEFETMRNAGESGS